MQTHGFLVHSKRQSLNLPTGQIVVRVKTFRCSSELLLQFWLDCWWPLPYMYLKGGVSYTETLNIYCLQFHLKLSYSAFNDPAIVLIVLGYIWGRDYVSGPHSCLLSFDNPCKSLQKLLALQWLLLDEALRMFFYQSEVDRMQQPRALRRLRPPTRKVRTVKDKMDLLSSPRAEVLFDFRGSGNAELNLQRGQLVFLLRQVNADWLEGTVNEQTGIFPQSFVQIIKPLSPSDCDGEGGHAYSCLRCFLLRPDATDARDVCVQEALGSQPTFKELLSRMRWAHSRRSPLHRP
uniref:SH3 domain-containing protein n=1 Tax=Periophthalmus magnuspinnatus TaxID=409849 RepID=A0A3B4A8A7_9GOBI